jgi:hypothetical protein
MLGLALVVAVAGAGAASGSGELPPRLAISTTSLSTNESVTIRVLRPAAPRGREIRLYLVPTEVAADVRSRFDERLSFVGSVASTRGARIVFSVPPLESGRYALAYWCRGCLPRANGIGVQASPGLLYAAPSGAECPITIPNGNRPPAAPKSTWRFHGNGWLWALRPPDGVIETNSLGGHKQFWVGRIWVGAPLTVKYRLLGDPATPFTKASTGMGTLSGYNGPSWASRMLFSAGCWQITARQLDVSLSYVVQVVVPAAP